MNTNLPPKPLHNTSQLLLRNINRLQGAHILVVNYPDDPFLFSLRASLPAATIVGFNHNYAPHQSLQHTYIAASLNAEDLIFAPLYQAPDRPYDVAIVFLPKSRALIELTLTMTAANLQPGAKLFLVGENDAGIRSQRAVLEKLIGPARSVDSARHCVLLQATLALAAPSINLDDWATAYPLEARHQPLTVVSLPGVFSHGRLDEGTQLLLETLDVPNVGSATGAHVLDFGCGAGVIGAVIKQTWPASKVELTDANALALEATRRTLLANNLPIEAITPSNIFSNIQGAYTQIVSNPPFHTGVKTDYAIVSAFLKAATQHLEKGGSLRIVANQFLKYQPLIEFYIGPCRVVAENERYRIYEGTRQ